MNRIEWEIVANHLTGQATEEENKKLSHLVVMKDLRIKELMNEKSAAIKMVKQLQKENDKLKAKK